jgi:hypothetical protein
VGPDPLTKLTLARWTPVARWAPRADPRVQQHEVSDLAAGGDVDRYREPVEPPAIDARHRRNRRRALQDFPPAPQALGIKEVLYGISQGRGPCQFSPSEGAGRHLYF